MYDHAQKPRISIHVKRLHPTGKISGFPPSKSKGFIYDGWRQHEALLLTALILYVSSDTVRIAERRNTLTEVYHIMRESNIDQLTALHGREVQAGSQSILVSTAEPKAKA